MRRSASWPTPPIARCSVVAAGADGRGEVVLEPVPGVFLRQDTLACQRGSEGSAALTRKAMCREDACCRREEQAVPGPGAAPARRRAALAAKPWKSVEVGERRPAGGRRRASFLSLVQEAAEGKDHEMRTESLILRRGSMRHLGDWFYPDGGWGWRVLAAVLLVQLLALGPLLGGGQALPLLLVKRLRIGPTLSTLVPALSLAAAQLLAPVAAGLTARYSARLPAVIGGLLVGLGWLFTSFSTQTHQVAISQLVVLAPGLALLQAAATAMLAQYFRRRRPLAETLLAAAAGLAVAGASLLLHRLAAPPLEWRFGLQVLAGLTSATSLLCLVYRPASLYHPQRHAILHLQLHMRLQRLGQPRTRRPPGCWPDLTILASPTVRWLLLCSAASAPLSLPFFLLAPAGRVLGLPEPHLVLLQLALGLAAALGSLLAGALLSLPRLPPRAAPRLLCQAALLACAALLLAAALLPPSPLLLLAGAVLYGVSWGAHRTALRLLAWRALRSRFPAAEALLQAAQALPASLSLALALTFPSLGKGLAAASLALAALALVLLPPGRRGRRAAGRGEGAEGEAGSKGEEATGYGAYSAPALGCDMPEVLWPGSLEGISSCNKVSNCVLLEEYRHNLSAALGKNLEEEEEVEDKEGKEVDNGEGDDDQEEGEEEKDADTEKK